MFTGWILFVLVSDHMIREIGKFVKRLISVIESNFIRVTMRIVADELGRHNHRIKYINLRGHR
jgi:hypothetical protein